MALYFETDQPSELLARYKAAVDDGQVRTWAYDDEGDFTHTAEQWKNSAWFRPKVLLGRLAFYILTPKDTVLSSAIYAIYHGRLCESFLRHCDSSFSNSIATSLPEGSDVI